MNTRVQDYVKKVALFNELPTTNLDQLCDLEVEQHALIQEFESFSEEEQNQILALLPDQTPA